MPYPQQPYYNPYQQQPPQNYYYPSGYPSMPMYPGPQSYMMPQQPIPHQPSLENNISSTAQQQVQQQQTSSQPSGMVAQEHNGMVFYMPASEATQQPASGESSYQPAESFVPAYAMPGLPPPTPAPEHPYYYPSAAVPGMTQVPANGATVYYGSTGTANGGAAPGS
jgi:hypothetical protein